RAESSREHSIKLRRFSHGAVPPCLWSHGSQRLDTPRRLQLRIKQISRSKRKQSVFSPNSIFVFFGAFCSTSDCFVLEHIFERSVEICIERVRPVRLCREVAPVFIHPEPGRWVLSHVRFKRIPACLGDLLM